MVKKFLPRRRRASEGMGMGLLLLLLLLLLALAAPRAEALVHPLALYYENLAGKRELDSQAELHCLALNVYHEARGEDGKGMLAVAAVTMNRVHSPAFPDTVCEVVWQRWQFSWTRDGRPDRPYEVKAWRRALNVATLVYEYGQKSNVGAATYYHLSSVSPRWARNKQVLARVGDHVFYGGKTP